jgi:DNA-binding transcriptional regulator GbsR (MarR family)
MKSSKSLSKLATSVGDFIRYWGFRRIHGQIWTYVYLNSEPMSGAELTRVLGVSKALVSPALSELVKYKLILVSGGDKKTKLYSANPDIYRVICDVLTKREKKLLSKTQANFEDFKKEMAGQANSLQVARMNELGSLISAGEITIEFVLKNLSSQGLTLWKLLTGVYKK